MAFIYPGRPMRSSPINPGRDGVFVAARGGKIISTERSAFARWFVLAAILIIPASMEVHLVGDGVKFTPGRAAIAILLVPALSLLLKPSRKFLISDLFVLLTSAWMIGARIPDDGVNPSAVAAAIELMGGYFVGRAYFYGPEALLQFLRIFKVLTVIVVGVAVLDQVFQQNVAETVVAMIMQTPWKPVQYRFGFIRAASTLEMAELYGTFCCVAGSLFLFLEKQTAKKYAWAAVSFFGCVLSLSSGPLLAFAVIAAFFIYDYLFQSYRPRWKLIILGSLFFLVNVFVWADHPLSWVVEHLTLDPETGYFRIYVFDYVTDQIVLAPYAGYGFGPIGPDPFLSTTTVDNVWLVCTARYGVPMLVLFILANLTSFIGTSRSDLGNARDLLMRNAATGLTQVIMTFSLVGLTVHFWNATWMLWAVSIGIRASIREWFGHEGIALSVSDQLIPLCRDRVGHAKRPLARKEVGKQKGRQFE